MATTEEVLAVLRAIGDRLRDPDAQQGMGTLSKSVQFECTDLNAAFVMEIEGGQVTSLSVASAHAPDIRVTTESDTLLGIAQGRINAMSAYISGQLQVKASFPDLLKLQQLF